MTKIVAVTLVLISLVLLPIVGCGPVRTQTYDYANFNGVEVGYAFRVEIEQADSYRERPC